MNLADFLTECPSGEIVVTGHRIGLYSVIDRYERGCTADEIHSELPALDLDLIRNVIAFREGHPAEVGAYVAKYRADLDGQESSADAALSKARRRAAERTVSTASPNGS
jgi:uncharacterized protein (DUF433 family)